ncbi:MAG: hypothetical protein D3906_02395 [Candidatus Electrothrix sp. AUS1_2]|nr:hypothetical protein [Candidatus Electrothrix sp. AUS1_2]
MFDECQEKIDLPLRQVPVIFFIKKNHDFYQKSIKGIYSGHSDRNSDKDRRVRGIGEVFPGDFC